MKKIEPVGFLTFIAVILLLLVLVQSRAHAQSPLEKKLSINLKDEQLKNALDKITAASGIKFTYNEQIAKSAIKITVKAKDKSLNQVLLAAFDNQPLQFSVLDNEIFIRPDPSKIKKAEAGPAANPVKTDEKYTISGTIKSGSTGETQIAATVRIAGTKQATASNEYGFYSLTLLKGNYALEVKAVGSKTYKTTIDLDKNTTLNIDLEEDQNQLETVNITSSSTQRNIRNPQMGMERLSIAETKSVPVLMGEPDLIKTLQLLPGVKTAGEGTSGMFVRGGSADQNMILLDEAPVYNATHLLGFFSTFNSDAIKNVTLYKSGMPAQYGGGLSSVLDVKMKDGNNQKFGVNGGIGLIAARLNVEGPIQR